ncbi:hypothetical protein Y032_0150g2784 [Ancylostoma ceylanicum]|uniref:Uncharacterized protein n=1 Tax=Ancylostoma ceylanicum TaxID=53326 RepID=A0A016T0K0_9BILA|nr:hypothetical protein Y032_0150g2784 [Ancylostoma ceylanicum]
MQRSRIVVGASQGNNGDLDASFGKRADAHVNDRKILVVLTRLPWVISMMRATRGRTIYKALLSYWKDRERKPQLSVFQHVAAFVNSNARR